MIHAVIIAPRAPTDAWLTISSKCRDDQAVGPTMCCSVHHVHECWVPPWSCQIIIVVLSLQLIWDLNSTAASSELTQGSRWPHAGAHCHGSGMQTVGCQAACQRLCQIDPAGCLLHAAEVEFVRCAAAAPVHPTVCLSLLLRCREG